LFWRCHLTMENCTEIVLLFWRCHLTMENCTETVLLFWNLMRQKREAKIWFPVRCLGLHFRPWKLGKKVKSLFNICLGEHSRRLRLEYRKMTIRLGPLSYLLSNLQFFLLEFFSKQF
jgi:hypothetical protein